MQSKYYCLTINNWNQEDLDTFPRYLEEGKITYFIVGQEVGESGTRHLQAYFELPRRLRLGRVKLLWPTGHFEARRGSAEQARDYCKKDNNFLEGGTLSRETSRQGARADLIRVGRAIIDGVPIRDIARTDPDMFIRYHRGMQELFNIAVVRHQTSDFHGPWRWNIEVTGTHIFWGDSGLGKTEYAKSLLPTALFVTHLDQLTQYDPSVYEGIIFDDMSFAHLPREAQIHLVDQDNDRNMHVRYRTAHIPRNTRKIFTTNIFAGRIFLTEDQAIRRRVTIHELN